jgi:hypothetical protein
VVEPFPAGQDSLIGQHTNNTPFPDFIASMQHLRYFESIRNSLYDLDGFWLKIIKRSI